MMQMILPGFENIFGWNRSELFIFQPEKVIKYYECRGYIFLADWNEGTVHVPERIVLPSGKILDESEILEALENNVTEMPERKELEGAFYYLNALYHEAMGTKRYDGVYSFLDDKDAIGAIAKYHGSPFYTTTKSSQSSTQLHLEPS